MIRPEDVRNHLDKRPFEAFRICMTDGRTYDVTHPELCLPGRNKVHVALPDPKARRFILRVDQCALVHIVRFEPLNGDGGRKETRKKNMMVGDP